MLMSVPWHRRCWLEPHGMHIPTRFSGGRHSCKAVSPVPGRWPLLFLCCCLCLVLRLHRERTSAGHGAWWHAAGLWVSAGHCTACVFVQLATRALQVHLVAACNMVPNGAESAEYCCRTVVIAAVAVGAAATPALLPPTQALRGSMHCGTAVLACRVVAVLLLPLLQGMLVRARQSRLRALTMLAASAPSSPLYLFPPSMPFTPRQPCILNACMDYLCLCLLCLLLIRGVCRVLFTVLQARLGLRFSAGR